MSRFINNFRAAANHNITKCLLDGYDKAWYKKHPAHQRAKIPFTATLALECESFLSSGRLSISGLATWGTSIAANMERARCTCALLFGIFFLLRKGEFLPKPTSCTNRNTQMRRAHLRLPQTHQSQSVFDVLLVQMVDVGEESGTLATLLTQAADEQEQALERQIDGMTQLIEPLMVVLLGGMVGGLVVALYLPVFQLGQVL
jgi:hypothetical protein